MFQGIGGSNQVILCLITFWRSAACHAIEEWCLGVQMYYTIAWVNICFPFLTDTDKLRFKKKCIQTGSLWRLMYRFFFFPLLHICPVWKCHGKYSSLYFTTFRSWRKWDIIAVEKNPPWHNYLAMIMHSDMALL